MRRSAAAALDAGRACDAAQRKTAAKILSPDLSMCLVPPGPLGPSLNSGTALPLPCLSLYAWHVVSYPIDAPEDADRCMGGRLRLQISDHFLDHRFRSRGGLFVDFFQFIEAAV